MIILFCLLLISSPSVSIAANPPMYKEYKLKTLNNIKTAWKKTDTELNGSAGTLSSSVVYYDAAKIAWELAELWPTERALFLSYLPKFAEITARSYIRHTFPASGYTTFPHGIYREWTRTHNKRMLTALKHLYSCQTEISGVSGFCAPNGTYKKVGYARALAYQIHTKIYAAKADIPSDGHLDKMVDYGLSMLNNWHNGNFSADPKFAVRQSFMVGLLLSALIEYYDQYNPDPRIPPAVQIAIDDLWTDAWYPDIRNPEPTSLGDSADYSHMTAGYGAFKYWMNWNEDHYEWDANHMANSADISPDLNNLIGPAYMWYALYSGDNSYRTKAEDIWKGWVVNGFAAYDKQFNQGSRQTYNFVKWYNQSTGDICDQAHPWLCKTKITCERQGATFYKNECIRHYSDFSKSTNIN